MPIHAHPPGKPSEGRTRGEWKASIACVPTQLSSLPFSVRAPSSLSSLRPSPPLMHQGEAGDSREGQKTHGLEIQFNTFNLHEISQISNKHCLKFIKNGYLLSFVWLYFSPVYSYSPVSVTL